MMKIESKEALKPLNQEQELVVFSGHAVPKMRYRFGADGKVQQVSVEHPWSQADHAHQTVVTPGLVDIQVNGFNGVDFNSPGLTAEKLDSALMAMLETGVTRCLPTLISAEEGKLCQLLSALDHAVQQSQLAPYMVMGYHIEGPFLSPQEGFVGAHPKQAMIAGSKRLVDKLQSLITKPILLMTVAPEIEGVLELIPYLKAQGITVALGHTAAERQTIQQAVNAGALLSTHLGNGLAHQLHKVDNPLMTQLAEERLFASFIADGHHVKPELLKLWLSAKTPEHSILTTDATAAAGSSQVPGIFHLGDCEIELCADGVVREPGSPYFAGSSARMDRMVNDIMRWCGYDLSTILQMTRYNPLYLLSQTKTLPVQGDDAEFLHWVITPDGPRLTTVYIGGWTIHL
ncbi:N-acetylglucosamine-6-phosphate deacetylase [Vibrio sp. TRT 17S01]|uniref:N-acetylglucosamine-6-phosphate deacetylase n=1 Tax=Vibrio sp. TRT 17S01 TaxID=3418505 RepID=UPI003CFBB763